MQRTDMYPSIAPFRERSRQADERLFRETILFPFATFTDGDWEEDTDDQGILAAYQTMARIIGETVYFPGGIDTRHLHPGTVNGLEYVVSKLRQAFLNLRQRLSDNPVDAKVIIKPTVEADAGGPSNVIWPEDGDE